jgi:hypothetical protein
VIFVAGLSVVYVFREPTRGWSGAIKPSARLRARGLMSVAGTSVLIGDKVFSRPAHGWSGNVKPSATLTPSGIGTGQASSPATLVTTSVSVPASGCVTGCPAQAAAVTRPQQRWAGHLHTVRVVKMISDTGVLPAALAGPDLFLSGGDDVRVYRLSGTRNPSPH